MVQTPPHRLAQDNKSPYLAVLECKGKQKRKYAAEQQIKSVLYKQFPPAPAGKHPQDGVDIIQDAQQDTEQTGKQEDLRLSRNGMLHTALLQQAGKKAPAGFLILAVAHRKDIPLQR